MGDETTWWTDNTTQREMTLDEWCATLPEGHRARRELTALLARLAAARGEDAPPSDAQSARQPGDPCDCGAMWAERDRLRTALAAAERAGAEAALEWAASNPAGFPVQFRGLPVTWNAADETVAMYQRRGLATLFPEATDA